MTKYRRGVLTDAAHEALREVFAKVCQDFEAALVESGGEDDHVHLLVEYPPNVAVSKRNRKSQADFSCIRCGHRAHADQNAARNLVDRAFVTAPDLIAPASGQLAFAW